MTAFTRANEVSEAEQHPRSVRQTNTKVPNFFLVGAPRCATTTLFYVLRSHPDIFMPYEARFATRSKWIAKEPHFFCPDLDLDPYVSIKSEAEYLGLFEKARNERRVGEASVCYLFSEDAPEKIANFCGESKIVIGLRNPVDWMKSWHHDMLDCGSETVVDFKQALDLEEQRSQGNCIPKFGCWKSCLRYRRMAQFSHWVEKYLGVFGEENVFVYTVEELRDAPEVVYERLFDFLEVEPITPTYAHENESKELHVGYVQIQLLKQALKRNTTLFRVLRWLKACNPPAVTKGFRSMMGVFPATRKDEFDSEFRAELLREFQPEIEKLGRLIRKDLSDWTPPVAGT